MKISTRLYLSTAIATVLISVVIVLVFQYSQKITLALQKVETANRFVKQTTNLIIVLDEYLTFGYERNEQQFEKIVISLGDLVGKLPVEDVSHVYADLQEIKSSFSRLKKQASTQLAGQGIVAMNKVTKELRDRLSSQVRVSSHKILSRAFKLSQYANRDIQSINQKTSFSVLSMAIILVLFLVVSAILMIRSISKPLQALMKEVGDIERGENQGIINLDSNVLQRNKGNEIGSLAEALTRMTRQLTQSVNCLKTEVKERQQAENAVLERNADLRISQQIVASVTDLMSFVGADYFYRSVNPAYCLYHDRKAEDIIDHSVAELIGTDIFQTVIKPEIDQALSGERVQYGEWFEFSGMGRRFVNVEYSPVLDGQDSIVGVVVSVRDITERKIAEEQKEELEILLRQKFKMEAVGTMAGGIAHNFNNNLSIILGNVELSQLKTNNSEINDLLSNAKIAVMRSRDLVSQIMTYSRQGDYAKAPLQLPIIIDETLKLLGATIPSTIQLNQTLSPDSYHATINADASQIQEILLNLYGNAVHAMDEEGELNISLDVVELTNSDLPDLDQNKPGHYAKISIQDNGCGMLAETQEKIFDPFFTTKELYEGTGMGLATVQGIINQHDGLIRVISIHGEGTTFELYFPVIEQSKNVEPTPINADLPKGTEKILFVDDDEMLAKLGEMMLCEMGYQVTMMTESQEALKLFAANADHFDLVITDQTMPQLTGKELIQKLKQIRPDIQTIICTGFSSKVDKEKAKKLGADAFMMKPLDLPVLLQTIRQVLDREKE